MPNKKNKEQIEIPVGKFFNNIWMILAIILAIIVIVLLVMRNSGSGSVNPSIAEQNLVSFINSQSQGQAQVTVISATKEDNLFKIMVGYQGQQIPVFVTLDGKYLAPQLIPLTADTSLIQGLTTPQENQNVVTSVNSTQLNNSNSSY